MPVYRLSGFPENQSRTMPSPFQAPQTGPKPAVRIAQNPQRPQPPPGDAQPLPSAAPVFPPAPQPMIQIPFGGTQPPSKLQLESAGDRISLTVHRAPLSSVLSLIAQQHGLNIVTADSVDQPVSVTLSNVPLEEALDAILRVNGYRWTRRDNIIFVSPIVSTTPLAAEVQGRRVQVFQLDYVAAADVEKAVQGLLSPTGKAFIIESSPLDRRRTRESIAVEDVPEVLDRIISYIAQVDHPPRQVLIEAKVLQITLSDELQHGINFDQLLQVANTNIKVRTVGFASPTATPSFLLGLDGPELSAIVEALEKTTDAKTLASPKVLAVNGQEARMQIGSRFGYFVTTSTQTSALQSVKFLEVGVVLKVTPTISRDGQILMSVMPEVSTGRINATSGLPEEDTTELATTVLLQDGKGMVIGGLIQETKRDTQSKIPLLGDIWGVGHLFRRINTSRIRSEIIVVLLPRIVPYSCEYKAHEDFELEQAQTPLLRNGILSGRPLPPGTGTSRCVSQSPFVFLPARAGRGADSSRRAAEGTGLLHAPALRIAPV